MCHCGCCTGESLAGVDLEELFAEVAGQREVKERGAVEVDAAVAADLLNDGQSGPRRCHQLHREWRGALQEYNTQTTAHRYWGWVLSSSAVGAYAHAGGEAATPTETERHTKRHG